MAGDLPHFEDAVRELYAGNKVGYDHFSYDWPPAIRDARQEAGVSRMTRCPTAG